MRDSSHIIMRIQTARSGTSTSSSRSTAIEYTSSFAKFDA